MKIKIWDKTTCSKEDTTVNDKRLYCITTIPEKPVNTEQYIKY